MSKETEERVANIRAWFEGDPLVGRSRMALLPVAADLLTAYYEAIRERDEARGFARSAEFHLGEVWDDGRMEHAEDCPEDDTCDCGVHKGFVYLARARGPIPMPVEAES